jgi:hypothetical protein
MNTSESTNHDKFVAYGKNDIFFGPQSALAYQYDLNDVEVHHFPLEEDLDVSSSLI